MEISPRLGCEYGRSCYSLSEDQNFPSETRRETTNGNARWRKKFQWFWIPKTSLQKLSKINLVALIPLALSVGYTHFLGETNGDLNVWFTMAHFETRNDLEIKGEGKDVHLPSISFLKI